MKYPVGTIKQTKDGYVFEKIHAGTLKKFVAQHRLVAEREIKGGALEHNERVYRRDGDKANNAKENLVILKFNVIKYRLKKTKIIYMPKP